VAGLIPLRKRFLLLNKSRHFGGIFDGIIEADFRHALPEQKLSARPQTKFTIESIPHPAYHRIL
jgi:hypothetical protein